MKPVFWLIYLHLTISEIASLPSTDLPARPARLAPDQPGSLIDKKAFKVFVLRRFLEFGRAMGLLDPEDREGNPDGPYRDIGEAELGAKRLQKRYFYRGDRPVRATFYEGVSALRVSLACCDLRDTIELGYSAVGAELSGHIAKSLRRFLGKLSQTVPSLSSIEGDLTEAVGFLSSPPSSPGTETVGFGVAKDPVAVSPASKSPKIENFGFVLRAEKGQTGPVHLLINRYGRAVSVAVSAEYIQLSHQLSSPTKRGLVSSVQSLLGRLRSLYVQVVQRLDQDYFKANAFEPLSLEIGKKFGEFLENAPRKNYKVSLTSDTNLKESVLEFAVLENRVSTAELRSLGEIPSFFGLRRVYPTASRFGVAAFGLAFVEEVGRFIRTISPFEIGQIRDRNSPLFARDNSDLWPLSPFADLRAADGLEADHRRDTEDLLEIREPVLVKFDDGKTRFCDYVYREPEGSPDIARPMGNLI